MNQSTAASVDVLLVDDHELVRIALRVLLEKSASIRVVAEAANAADAIAKVRSARPQLVLLDIQLPDGNGIELCREISECAPLTRVLLLTGFAADRDAVLAAVLGGAAGYVHKTLGIDALVIAVQTVAAGHPYLDPEATDSLFTWLRSPLNGHAAWSSTLTPQERRVIALAAEGHTNKQIGHTLGLTEKTVKNYLSNAYDKLRISRRSQAAALYHAENRTPALATPRPPALPILKDKESRAVRPYPAPILPR